MSEVIESENIVWTPQMPDRRKHDRRNNIRDFNPNGKSLNISDRRAPSDRRKRISVTITGRAIDVEELRS